MTFGPRLLTLLAVASGPTTLVGCSRGELAGAARSAAGASEGSTAARASNASLALPVTAEAVRHGDLVLSLRTTGQVRSRAKVTLRAEAAGTVARVLVQPGSGVRHCQPVAHLDARRLDLAVREAEAAVEEAKLRYLEEIVPESLVTGKPPSTVRREYAYVKAGVRTAQLRLERARLERERATIVAPFTGVVDAVAVAEGEPVAAGQEVVTVVDLSNLIVEAAVLEHDLPLVRVGGQAIVTTTTDPSRQAMGPWLQFFLL